VGVMDLFLSILTVQVPTPVHSPDQPVNVDPDAGVGVKTALPLAVYRRELTPEVTPVDAAARSCLPSESPPRASAGHEGPRAKRWRRTRCSAR
jgi:hypothetical protein